MEEDDYQPRKKKKKSIWTMQRIAMLVIFLVGFALGVYVTNQFIDPTLDLSFANENAELLSKNQQLDTLNDAYYSCLQIFEIDPATCVK